MQFAQVCKTCMQITVQIKGEKPIYILWISNKEKKVSANLIIRIIFVEVRIEKKC